MLSWLEVPHPVLVGGTHLVLTGWGAPSCPGWVPLTTPPGTEVLQLGTGVPPGTGEPSCVGLGYAHLRLGYSSAWDWGTPGGDLGPVTGVHPGKDMGPAGILWKGDGIPPTPGCEQTENITFPIVRMWAVTTKMKFISPRYFVEFKLSDV